MARLCVFLAAAAVAGCAPTPSAPALTDEAVFESADAGMKFVAPQGWTMTLRTTLPPGRVEKPVLLVRYQSLNDAKPGEFRAYAADVPEGEPLLAYIEEHPIGPHKWRAKPASQPLTINGHPAERIELITGKGEMDFQEVTAFRRGGRCYFTLASWTKRDTSARDMLRECVNTVSFP